jgi:hypothetical protein
MGDALGAQACLGFRKVVFDGALVGYQRTNLAGAKLASSRSQMKLDVQQQPLFRALAMRFPLQCRNYPVGLQRAIQIRRVMRYTAALE